MTVLTNADVEHGTNSGYSQGCRCDRCATAHTQAAQLRRESIRRWKQQARIDLSTRYGVAS